MIRVTAAILMKDERVLIARRRDDDSQGGKWEFPGGKIELSETPHQCLMREMKEEFGIDVSVGELFGKSTCHYESGMIQLLAYHAVWTGGTFSMNAHADYRWVPLEQLQDFEFAQADINIVKKLQLDNFQTLIG